MGPDGIPLVLQGLDALSARLGLVRVGAAAL